MQHCLLKKMYATLLEGKYFDHAMTYWYNCLIINCHTVCKCYNTFIHRMYFYICSKYFTISKFLLIIFNIRYYSQSHWIAIDFLWYIFLRIFVSTIYTMRPWNVGIHIFVNDVKCVSFLTRESMIHHLFAYLQK